jgi:hypothetical protein
VPVHAVEADKISDVRQILPETLGCLATHIHEVHAAMHSFRMTIGWP